MESVISGKYSVAEMYTMATEQLLASFFVLSSYKAFLSKAEFETLFGLTLLVVLAFCIY